MKSLLFLSAFIFFIGIQSFSQEGIQFENASWEEVLAKAAEQNKVIFMDAYASWCAPCKMMSRDVFTDPAVGAHYNEHFINVKIDMEKGDGIALANDYQVQVYPTLLFIDSEGAIVHRSVGYHDSDQFLDLAKDALNPSTNMAAMRKNFVRGNRKPEFLRNYTTQLYDAMDPGYGEVMDAYLEGEADWGTDVTREFILQYVSSMNSPAFEYMMENKEAFFTQFGEEIVVRRVQQLAYQAIRTIEDGDALFTTVQSTYETLFGEEAGPLFQRFQLDYHAANRDVEKYTETAVQYLDNKAHTPSWDELNEIAWQFYEVVEDKAMLKKAVKWAEQSVKIKTNYFNTDTVAALYYKLGKKKKALAAAEKAIEVAKENGEDYSSTAELLEQIKAL